MVQKVLDDATNNVHIPALSHSIKSRLVHTEFLLQNVKTRITAWYCGGQISSKYAESYLTDGHFDEWNMKYLKHCVWHDYI